MVRPQSRHWPYADGATSSKALKVNRRTNRRPGATPHESIRSWTGALTVASCGLSRVRVHNHAGQFRDCMDEVVFRGMGEIVGACERGVAVDVEVSIGMDLVTDPTHPDPADRHNSGNRLQAGFGRLNKVGIDGVHQPPQDLADRGPQHEDDGHSDQQADDGSASCNPAATPGAPNSTANEVRPSIRACWPSATSAADPIRLPTRIR